MKARIMAAAPKSLLQIAGAPLTPSPLDKSALVIIDAQSVDQGLLHLLEDLVAGHRMSFGLRDEG